jgi:GAF domain-containing protein
MSQAFNDMVERLQRQFRRLRALALIDRGILARKARDDIVCDVLRDAVEITAAAFAALALADRLEPDRFTLFLRLADPPAQPDPQRRWFRPAPAERELIASQAVISVGPGDDRFHALLTEFADLRESHLRVAPILTEEHLTALLLVGDGGKDADEAEAAWMVREIADRVAVALANAAWEERLEYLAWHDPLTQLPNRLLLSDRLDQVLAQAQRSDTGVAIIFLDLDRFKIVNDSLGHGAGDAVLVHLAQTLTGTMRAGDTLARLAGDEFVVLATNFRSPDLRESVLIPSMA